jgi:hypothetical protein
MKSERGAEDAEKKNGAGRMVGTVYEWVGSAVGV